MDDSQRAGDAAGNPLQAGSAPRPDGDAGQLHFIPLRLILRPGTTTVELTRPEMVVGRHTEADIRLSLPDVSRRHCRLVYAANRWQIFDLNSLNGVFVNGDRVQQATLDEGDSIRIGGITFQVELGASAPAQAALTAKKEGPPRPNVLKSIANALPPSSHDWDPPHRQAS